MIVEGEWGWVEEITSTDVVVRLWDWRRMVLPIAYFLEKPFQNWTRESASLIGSVYLYLDYSVPVEAVRTKLSEIAAESKLCDGKVINLQVSDARERVVELRALVSARTAPQCWESAMRSAGETDRLHPRHLSRGTAADTRAVRDHAAAYRFGHFCHACDDDVAGFGGAEGNGPNRPDM